MANLPPALLRNLQYFYRIATSCDTPTNEELAQIDLDSVRAILDSAGDMQLEIRHRAEPLAKQLLAAGEADLAREIVAFRVAKTDVPTPELLSSIWQLIETGKPTSEPRTTKPTDDYGDNLDRDKWLFDNWLDYTREQMTAWLEQHTSENGWEPIQAAAQRTAVTKYANHIGKPVPKGKAGPRKQPS